MIIAEPIGHFVWNQFSSIKNLKFITFLYLCIKNINVGYCGHEA
jgi:hypothetical protein